ncbi:MAG: 4-(cytidine 5'-diphospho)-2-C-methyl-D-erythritol kinase [Pseudomonadota bacterium]
MSILKAHAKINLFFHITGKREDSYHLIDSLMVFAKDIYDEIEIIPSNENFTKIVAGEFGHFLLEEKNNLIDKVLNKFSNAKKYQCNLTKNIPIGAGLGGGSSDAATVARYLNQNISNEELARIGADVPICYLSKASYCEGIGEIISPLNQKPNLHLVLVNPKKILLTQDVFNLNKKIDIPYIEKKPIGFKNTETFIDFLLDKDNVLTESAIDILPEIKDILELLLLQKDCLIARMSGSGPTCFGIFKNKNLAVEAESIIKKTHPNYWVKYTEI